MSGTGVGLREGARAPPPRLGRQGATAQDLAGGATGEVLEELAELGEAQLDEADEALADPRLFGHQRHREASRLAQLGTLECITGDRLFTHGHLGEAPRIGLDRTSSCRAGSWQSTSRRAG